MRHSKVSSLIMLAISILALTGCQTSEADSLKEVPRNTYEKLNHDTVIVQKGDVQPVLEVPLNNEAMEYISYTVDTKDVELKEILVATGDYVKEGQEMVIFESESLEKKVEEQREDIAQKKLLLDHVKKMRAINVDETKLENESMKAIADNYDMKISMLQDDIDVATIYLNEREADLRKCKLIAQKAGTVTFINNNLLNGIIVPGTGMITVTSGEVRFSAEVKDDYEFRIGDIYTAESDSWNCEVVVTNVEDNDGRGVLVYFKPLSEDVVYVGRDKFTITINKEEMKNVVYVNQDAVREDAKGNAYVYVMDVDGFYKIKYVETSALVGNMIIIKSGLEGGEEVVVR